MTICWRCDAAAAYYHMHWIGPGTDGADATRQDLAQVAAAEESN